jgi:3-keto-5-aminohexanoate cleavage enzyme
MKMSKYSERFPDVTPPVIQLFGEKFAEVKIQKKWNIPDKLVIKTAVTGIIMDRDQNPNQAYSTQEIRDEAIACIEAGACSIHVHVRDENGNITNDRRYYHEVIDPIREKYGDRVHFDGETAFGDTFEEAQLPITEGLLESSAVNTTGTFLGDTLVGMPPRFVQAQAQVIQENNRKAQIAVYNLGDVDNADRYLIQSGILNQPYEWIIVPALPGCAPMPNEMAMCEVLLTFINRIKEVDPAERPFILVCAAGRATNYLSTLAILLGLHVRIGMEDTIWRYPHKDVILTNNREVVLSTVEIAKQLGREPATADEYRKMVGIK